MVQKITLGVFLGIIAAYFVVHLLSENERSQETRRQLDLTLAVMQLKPDYVMARCGKPSEDTFDGIVRRMRYAPFVTFQFTKIDDDWAPPVHLDYAGLATLDDRILAKELPCLALPK